jgi:hypothetical protein
MKTVAVLLGAFLLLAAGAGAQTSPANSEGVPKLELSSRPTVASEPTMTASLLPSEFALPDPVAAASPNWAPLPAAVPAVPPQGVEGVFPSRNWQAYLGYTFLRFYEVPNQTVNESGFNGSVAYYFRDWIAADGELFAAFGSQGGTITSSVMAAGGPRLRWAARTGPELWVHVLIGGSHFTPQTVYGSENAFGFEMGGGVDINSHHRRLAYRLQADVVGTRFFSTYQYSPKISAGIVFKF